MGLRAGMQIDNIQEVLSLLHGCRLRPIHRGRLAEPACMSDPTAERRGVV